MCGIFGIISSKSEVLSDIKMLAKHAKQRGRDSSGLFILNETSYQVHRADHEITRLLRNVKPGLSKIIMGHSRLITNGVNDNQPVIIDGFCVLHNETNDAEIWEEIGQQRKLDVDTEVIAGIAAAHFQAGGDVETLPARVLNCGVVACALAIPSWQALPFSNNGLYLGKKGELHLFASESFALNEGLLGDRADQGCCYSGHLRKHRYFGGRT